ncbi:hypothetical protein TNCV_3880511 [Trichonephila clavipes]|nr:hypothetical protein TNCV_3880511 [Trichonephila clavipes]
MQCVCVDIVTVGLYDVFDDSRFSLQSDSCWTIICRTSDTRCHQNNIIGQHRYGRAGIAHLGGLFWAPE